MQEPNSDVLNHYTYYRFELPVWLRTFIALVSYEVSINSGPNQISFNERGDVVVLRKLSNTDRYSFLDLEDADEVQLTFATPPDSFC